jgi:hypothetical protein
MPFSDSFLAQGPRVVIVQVPFVLNRYTTGRLYEPEYSVYKTSQRVPLAHFYIDGFWVFKATNGKETSALYGISTEGKVHTWLHAPYDGAFHDEIEKLKKKYVSDVSSIYFGRPHDTQNMGMNEIQAENRARILEYLKVKPGDKGSDLKILHLSDRNLFGKDFEFPK